MRRFLFLIISISFLLVFTGILWAAPSWTFDDPEEIDTWSAVNQCNYSVENGVLITESTGGDPYLFPGGEWNVVDWEPFSGAAYTTIYMRLKLNQASTWQVYYITEENGTWGEEQRQNFELEASDDFVDVTMVMERGGWQDHTVNHFRIDPGTVAGVVAEIDYISLEPLAASAVDSKDKIATTWAKIKK
ncbi:hypothetical protein GF312_21675 [Candidatus Poribacteria bacterium]|nr:hypothetical protein [Candidatus Poribacteria bacterium]